MAVRGRPGRRVSPDPGHFTRAQVEAALRLSAGEREALERSGVLVASGRRAPGDTRPVLYSQEDMAVAQAAVAAQRLGLRGEQLRRVADAVRLKQRRFAPGWVGFVLVDDAGDVELSTAHELTAALAAYPPTSPVLVLPVGALPSRREPAA